MNAWDDEPDEQELQEPLFVIMSEGEIYQVESLNWSSLIISSPIRQPRPFTLTSEGFREIPDVDEIPF